MTRPFPRRPRLTPVNSWLGRLGRLGRVAGAAAWLGAALPLSAALPTPGDRTPTDPHSIGSPANPAAAAVPVADLYYSRSVRGPAWSPDGRQVVFATNFSGRYNLWKVAAQGGWPIQVSRSEEVQSGAAWSPDGRWIVFQRDRAGDEIFNLFAVPAVGGEAVNLGESRDVSAEGALWAPDGSSLAFARREKTSSMVDVALLDWRTRSTRNLTHEDDKNHLWSALAWSPDGRSLFATRANVNFRDSDVYRIDVASGVRTNLTPHQGESTHQAAALSRDGRTLLLISNELQGLDSIALLDLGAASSAASARPAALTWVTHGPWEAEAGDISPDGRRLAYVLNEDGRGTVYLADLAAPQRAERIDFPPGVTQLAGSPVSFSPDGSALMLSHTDAGRPADVWMYDLASHRPRQLTYSALAGLVPERLPATQLVHYPSFDGTLISAFLWMPFNLQRNGANPAVVIAHGGPTGQSVDVFNAAAVALASRGYVVIAPNVRGSTGYGAAFEKSNYQDLGGGDLQDYVYGARFLAATGFVAADRVGIYGGSYGGYMAMMAIGKTPDVWAAAVELFGITDWLTEQQHEDPMLQQYDQSKLGDPVRDRAAYEKASPIRYFHDAKAPLFVLQGANDVRDPKEEAEQAVTVLQREGKVVDAHYYADEGHGFTKRENQIDALERTVAWFDRYLKTPAKAPAGAAAPH